MLFTMESGATLVPGLTPLRLGDVIELDGELAIVDYVNDCRARVRPVLGTTVKVTTRFGQQAEFERASGSVNVARNIERDMILERLGKAGLEQLLASRTAQRDGTEVGGPATENETNERIIIMANKLRALKGEKKTRKPRGGLAADMAAEGAAAPVEAKPKRSRKAKETDTAPGSKGKLGEIFGHSVVSVIRTLAKGGCSTAHVKAIMEARGVEAKPATVQIQCGAGRSGQFGGKPVSYADLTAEQVKELTATASDPKKE